MTLEEESLKLDQVRKNFSRHAAEYDLYARVQRTVAEKLLRRMAGATPAPRKVLEIGCGTGILSRLFQQTHADAELLLSDIAHGMSRHVATEFPALAVVDADAADLPFQGESFDRIISSSVYQWVDHLAAAFAELHRVLQVGGRLVLALFGERTLFELKSAHAVAMQGRSSHGQGFPDIDQVRFALGELFTVELLESSEEIEWHRDVPQLLRALKAIGAQNASRQRPSGLASRRTMESMYHYYAQAFGVNGKIPATYEVIYLVARKN